jgi:hypothetical protein
MNTTLLTVTCLNWELHREHWRLDLLAYRKTPDALMQKGLLIVAPVCITSTWARTRDLRVNRNPSPYKNNKTLTFRDDY